MSPAKQNINPFSTWSLVITWGLHYFQTLQDELRQLQNPPIILSPAAIPSSIRLMLFHRNCRIRWLFLRFTAVSNSIQLSCLRKFQNPQYNIASCIEISDLYVRLFHSSFGLLKKYPFSVLLTDLLYNTCCDSCSSFGFQWLFDSSFEEFKTCCFTTVSRLHKISKTYSIFRLQQVLVLRFTPVSVSLCAYIRKSFLQ